jgi:pyridoxal phosphate enzyme (YggS family)
MPTISDNLNIVNQKIAAAASACGRSIDDVKLVAVAKTASSSDLIEAYAAGQRLFAHNRVQELEEQRRVLPDAEWHLLGPLQGKKVRRGISACEMYQALGDMKTAQRIARVLEESEDSLEVLLQVNVNPADGRYGLHLEQVADFCEQIAEWPAIRVSGLMNLAAADADDSQLHRDFASMRTCLQALQQQNLLADDAVLSMGMSNDFEIAIAEGANLVRVGRDIFPATR